MASELPERLEYDGNDLVELDLRLLSPFCVGRVGDDAVGYSLPGAPRTSGRGRAASDGALARK